jgi:integrase
VGLELVSAVRPPSGHVFRVDRARGPVWYATYRLPDGRQVQKKLGPAWSERGRPPTGYFTKRLAQGWLRFIEHDRERKPSTVRDYRSILEDRLLPVFGSMPIEEFTATAIERWRSSLGGLSNRTKNKLLIVMQGIFRRAQSVYGLPVNPLARIEKHPQHSSGDIEVFSREEVWALVRGVASEQDGAGCALQRIAGAGPRRRCRGSFVCAGAVSSRLATVPLFHTGACKHGPLG